VGVIRQWRRGVIGEGPAGIRQTKPKRDVFESLPSRGSMLCTIVSFVSSSVHKILRQVSRSSLSVRNPLTQNTRKADALSSSEPLLLGGAIVPLYSA
jgi:hypothetical protein